MKLINSKTGEILYYYKYYNKDLELLWKNKIDLVNYLLKQTIGKESTLKIIL